MNHCLYAVPLKLNSKQNRCGVGPTVESSAFCYYQTDRGVILACSDFLKINDVILHLRSLLNG